MNYKYTLEKGSRKHNCPQCGKKTFVRFVNNETCKYLPMEFGRCDRENKCGYWRTSKCEFNYSKIKDYPRPQLISYHPIEMIERSGRNFKQNNFVQFLKSLFCEDEVKSVIRKYLLGTSKLWNGATIFWQIDNNQKIRHGKIMLYNIHTGKRAKDANGKAFINSVRSTLKLQDYNLRQCMFGLHLINESETRMVAIVESEKTAIVMSLFKPEYVWLATGSKQGFKYEMLEPLKGFKLIVFPDKSEYRDWLDMAKSLRNFGFDISVSKFIEETDFAEGSDLADVFIKGIKALTRTVASGISDTGTIGSKADNIILKLVKINPALRNLITEFDLSETIEVAT